MKTKTQHTKTYGTLKAVLGGNFIAINTYIQNQERSQINNLTLQLEKVEKEQPTTKANRRKVTIKITAERNKIENKNTIEESH